MIEIKALISVNQPPCYNIDISNLNWINIALVITPIVFHGM